MNGALRVVASSLVLALVSSPLAGAEEFLLYAPEPSEGKRPTGPEEGVLVKSITIRKGDTLYGLSRRYGGKGTYYPQILLFNEIRNPDLIYAGNRLLVPLPPEGKGEAEGKRPKAEMGAKIRRERALPRPAPPAQVMKKETIAPPAAPPKAGVEAKVPVPAAPKPAAEPARPPVPRKSEEGEQVTFEQGVSAYKSGNFQQSVEAFDRFLARYPSSPLVPDATLYRADALLKLAGQ